MEKYEPLNKFFKNTRRHRRFSVEWLGIRLSTKPGAKDPAVAEDYSVKKLSLGGVLMEGERPHEPESKLLVEMGLPDDVRISLNARVTTCLPVKNSPAPRYEIGMEFASMSEQDKTKLKKLIHWLYLKDAGFTD